jgi:hypothetical protein
MATSGKQTVGHVRNFPNTLHVHCSLLAQTRPCSFPWDAIHLHEYYIHLRVHLQKFIHALMHA